MECNFMKSLLFFSLLFVSIASITIASEPVDKKAPLKVVESLFDEMAAGEPAKIAALFAPGAQLYAIMEQPDGSVRRQTFTADTFSAMFRDKSRNLKEIMYDPKVEIDGEWAMVWGRYIFYVDGKISHCGINQLNLVKIDGVWKLANGATTMQPNGCSDKEKAFKHS